MVLLSASGSTLSVPLSLETFLSQDTDLKQAADTFKAKEIRNLTTADGALYVHEREWALTRSCRSVRVLFSTEATTCHVVVIRSDASGATALAHCAAAEDCHDNVNDMVGAIRDMEKELSLPSPTTLSVSVVGGFCDEFDRSKEVSLALLKALVNAEGVFRLQLCCIGSANTVHRTKGDDPRVIPLPLFYGCAVDAASGEVFPAEMDYFGPEETLRRARVSFCRDEDTDRCVYDWRRDEVVIPAFSFHQSWQLDFWLRQADDRMLLDNLSTSPDAERDDFVPSLRRTMAMVRDNPRPLETVFKNGRDKRFKLDADTQQWRPVEA